MELPELPECPVCLQSYDSDYTIPRVLPCGHTTCETCLRNLPEKYPQTIRCPGCTQLVKYPSQQGPSSLPKNIDLLRLIKNPKSPNSQNEVQKRPNDLHVQTKVQDFDFSRLWSDHFYETWNPRIVDKDAAFIKEGERKVRLLKVSGSGGDVNGSVFKVSYKVRVLSVLNGMKERGRQELGLFFWRFNRICEVCGLWGDVEAGDLYLVSERSKNGSVLENWERFEEGFGRDGLCGFAMVSMEMCEAIVGVHLEGLVLGCLGLSCFEFDDFGHVKLSLSEVLVLSRCVQEGVKKAGVVGRRVGGKEMGELFGDFLKSKVFLSPEVFSAILKSEDLDVECCGFENPVGYASDIWTLGVILLAILIGRHFVEVIVDHVECILSNINEANCLDCSCFYAGLQDKVNSLLESKFGEEFVSLQKILCSCLNFDPSCRPEVFDVWKSVRELIRAPQFDTMPQLDRLFSNENSKLHCLVNSELCQVPKEISEVCEGHELLGAEKSDGNDANHTEAINVDKSFVEGVIKGNVKFKDMCGHRDCVTGLAIGGGFLFSSSFDKSVHVWSLQDFSHVHTLKGHEHKVMAVIYVDEQQPLCVSGDSGGGIFIWNISTPLGKEPLKMLYEEKDWRYSGIHALTTAGNGHLYTGSGDRSIKKWSLQDGTLSCIMEGHKSVVSTLAASNGVLYSGSWDGTIRLWSVSDNRLLTVLGEDIPGNMTSVISLTANGNTLVAGHENGHIKMWRDDIFMKSIKLHSGAIFALEIEGKWLFSGGWDKSINVQELSGDEFKVDVRPVGSIPGASVITTLSCWQGMLFVGYGDRNIRVFYNGIGSD